MKKTFEWFDVYKSSSLLSEEQRLFLSTYTEEEFSSDYVLLSREGLCSGLEPYPITIYKACEEMMRL